MGKVVNVKLYFSDVEWRVATALNLDIVETCRTAIKQEIRDRAEVQAIVNKPNFLVEENRRLLHENRNLRDQIAQAPMPIERKIEALARFGHRR